MEYTSDLTQLGLGVHRISYNPKNTDEQQEAQRLIDQLAELTGTQGALRPMAPAVAQPMLSDVMLRFLGEMRTNKRQSTADKYEHTLQCFLELMGDMPITAVSQTTLGEFKGKIARLPRHASKRPSTRGKMLAQLIEHEHKELIAPRTLNTHLRNVVSFMAWAGGHYAGIQRVSSAKLAIPIKTRADEERAAFSDDDLQKLFGERFRELPEYKRWLLLMGLFTGARIEELCQLNLTTDVYQDEGIWVFDFNDLDDKNLKTKASKRRVPIHPMLLRLGILEYFEAVKARGYARPFEHVWDAYKGKFSKNASKWVGRYIDGVGITDKRKVFHSFRHTALDRMKQAGVEEGKAAAVAGQTYGGISYSRYGKSYQPSVLLDTVSAISVPSLNETLGLGAEAVPISAAA